MVLTSFCCLPGEKTQPVIWSRLPSPQKWTRLSMFFQCKSILCVIRLRTIIVWKGPQATTNVDKQMSGFNCRLSPMTIATATDPSPGNSPLCTVSWLVTHIFFRYSQLFQEKPKYFKPKKWPNFPKKGLYIILSSQ